MLEGPYIYLPVPLLQADPKTLETRAIIHILFIRIKASNQEKISPLS
jgi:hypothetical protein